MVRPGNRRPSAIAVAVGLVLIQGHGYAAAQTPSLEEMWQVIQQQQEQIESLQEENKQLREQVQAVPSTLLVESFDATPVEREAVPDMGAADSDSSGTQLSIYGHAMLDMGYQSKQNDPAWFDVLRPTKLPSYENEFGSDGKFYSGVRQSRLGVESITPTSLGDLKTIIEFELFGVGSDAGETTFRLRHAWGELGQFGAGQYWSTFMDIDVFPNSIEYWGPNAMVFYRNVQARWTPWRDGDSRFAIALERPGASGDGGRFSDFIQERGVAGDFDVPDLAAHYRLADDWGHVQLAGILRRIAWKDANAADGVDLSGSETGWGLNFSGNYKIGPHVLRGSVVYGEGIQNYMNDASADIGVVTNNGLLEKPLVGEAIPLLGLVGFIDLNWSDQWTSTVGYSVQENDLPSTSQDTAFESGQYALANLLWHPVPQVMMGPEIQWGKRDNFGSFSSEDLRIQFSAKYTFRTSIGGL